MTDFGMALRFLKRSPALAGAALVSLALGIGTSSAVFSVVEALLLKPLPFAAQEELVYANETAGADRALNAVSGPDLDDWRARQHAFSQLAGFRRTSFTLTGSGPAERIDAAAMESGTFAALRVPALRGRTLIAPDDAAGAARVAVVSERFVRSHGDVQSLVLDGQPYTVVGVMPASFRFPLDGPAADVWVQPRSAPFGNLLGERALFFYEVLGRLRPGATIEEARAELQAITASISAAHPDSHAQRGALLVPLREQLVGKDRGALLLLFCAVGLLLLIACANVGSLFLARAVARRHELSVRAALGASRGRLLRQLLVETLVIGLAGGALGVLVCALSLDAVSAALPENLPRLRELRVDAGVVGFAALVSLLSCAVFGTGPAMLLSRASANEALRSGGHGSLRALKLRGALVVCEVALALALLIDAAVLSRSLWGAQKTDPGFNPHGLSALDVTLPAARYPEAAQIQFAQDALRRVQAIPGVSAAAFLSPLPVAGRSIGLTVSPKDRQEPHPPQSALSSLSPGALSLLSVPLLAGREFTEQDKASAPPVVVINRALAQLLWPSQDAVGKRIGLGPGDPESREVVGVVGDLRPGLDVPAGPQIYAPYAQVPWPFGSFVLKTALSQNALREALRQELSAVDSSLPVAAPRSLETALSGTLASRRFLAGVLGLFSLAALLLAVFGVYGALSYAVAQRKRELAIRAAIGAAPSQVLQHVLRQGLALGGAGIMIGIALALASSRLLSAHVFGIRATDPWSYAVMGSAMLVLCLFATLWPARRATRSDPAEALRAE
ncbi:MAG TPA: ABC transporter permease [Myxococcales bacterium]|jgi:predicted permease